MQRLHYSEIKTNPDNPRIITDDKFKKLVKSIKEFPEMLEKRPLVLNKDKVILGGNMRYKACIEAGIEEIPVIIADDWDEEKQKEFVIKDNVSGGEWDWDALANEWDGELLTDWGVDLPIGFGDTEEAEEDDYEIPDEIKTDIVLGDLFEIGTHKLLCGDSTKVDDVEKLMNGEKADMVFTDPPYSVNYEKKQREVLKSKDYNHIENDDLNVADISEQIWKPVFKNMYDMAKDECSFYVTMPQGGDQMMMMMMMMMGENWQVKHELIWLKPSPVFSMGRLDYDYKHEPIMYGWKKKHKWYGAGEFNKSVWEIDRDGNKSHPTMKPIKLVGNAIQNSSQVNDIIIDYFLGSGSTMVASHQLKRRCYGIEVDPKYVEVILQRMLKLDPGIEIKRNGEKYIKTID